VLDQPADEREAQGGDGRSTGGKSVHVVEQVDAVHAGDDDGARDWNPDRGNEPVRPHPLLGGHERNRDLTGEFRAHADGPQVVQKPQRKRSGRHEDDRVVARGDRTGVEGRLKRKQERAEQRDAPGHGGHAAMPAVGERNRGRTGQPPDDRREKHSKRGRKQNGLDRGHAVAGVGVRSRLRASGGRKSMRMGRL